MFGVRGDVVVEVFVGEFFECVVGLYCVDGGVEFFV